MRNAVFYIFKLLIVYKPVRFFDKLKQFFPSNSFFTAGDEILGQLLPCLFQFLHVMVHVLPYFSDGQFVCLGEDDGEGDGACPEPFDELQVDFLGLVTDVNKYKEVQKLPSLQDVFRA